MRFGTINHLPLLERNQRFRRGYSQPMAGLKRPDGLAEDEWTAIKEAETRLLRAKAASDGPLVVGSAKELCEAIAKVIIAERGGVPAASASMSELITMAHKLLEFQPGEGLANDAETRKVAQGLKSVVVGLGEMRNRHGTGHGRPTATGITDEHAELAFDAAMLWSSWALRRLEPYIAGDVTALVRDLEGEIFRRGDLKRRLNYANLAHLPEVDQRRLGLAVARRASQDTFVVVEDGVEAVQPGDPDKWPPNYVESLLIGLFFDANGYLNLKSWKVKESARILSLHPDPVPILHELAERTSSAGAASGVLPDDQVRQSLIADFEATADQLPDGEARELWLTIAARLRPDEA